MSFCAQYTVHLTICWTTDLAEYAQRPRVINIRVNITSITIITITVSTTTVSAILLVLVVAIQTIWCDGTICIPTTLRSGKSTGSGINCKWPMKIWIEITIYVKGCDSICCDSKTCTLERCPCYMVCVRNWTQPAGRQEGVQQNMSPQGDCWRTTTDNSPT